MAKGEVWNQVETLFRFGGIKVAEARLFVAQDDSKPLSSAFQMLCSFRIFGAQIDDDNRTNNFPVTNGKITVPVTVSAFSTNVDGDISNWHGSDPDGSASSGSWEKAEKVGFTLEALGKVTIPVADILSLVPGIGGILKALLSALPGQQVSWTLGQVLIDIPVHRVNGTVQLPSGAVVPQWWP